jgi:hypothetical protein
MRNVIIHRLNVGMWCYMFSQSLSLDRVLNTPPLSSNITSFSHHCDERSQVPFMEAKLKLFNNAYFFDRKQEEGRKKKHMTAKDSFLVWDLNK